MYSGFKISKNEIILLFSCNVLKNIIIKPKLIYCLLQSSDPKKVEQEPFVIVLEVVI